VAEALAAPPAHWSGEVVLADGSTALLRPIGSDDAARLEAFHSRLSADTIYLRFFGPHPRLSVEEVRHFTHVDHRDRVAFVLVRDDALIAVGRYDRVAGSHAAEVAFVVDDAYQGRGIGTLLLERLAAAAGERGLTRFVADTLPQNRAMLRVFHDTGFEVTSRFEDGVVRVSFPIATTPETRRAMLERERQATARSVRAFLEPEAVAGLAEGAAGEATLDAVLAAIADAGFAGPVTRRERGVAGGQAGLWLVAAPEASWGGCLEEAARAGARAVVLLAGDPTAEATPVPGRDRALARRAGELGMRLLGPESLGVLRPSHGLHAVVTPVGARRDGPPSTPRGGDRERRPRGRGGAAEAGLGLFSESPRLGSALLAAATARGLPLSGFVSAGCKAELSASDVMRYWERDTATGVVALELRNAGNPRRSPVATRLLARQKPVLVWLSQPLRPWPAGLFAALVARTGAIPCRSAEDMLDVAEALLPSPRRKPEPHVTGRIARWRAWRRRRPERFVFPEAVDAPAARGRVDEVLASAPSGAALGDDETLGLLRCFGLAEVAAQRLGEASRGADPGQLVLRVRQDADFGPWLAVEPPGGEPRVAVPPLSPRTLRRLLAGLAPTLRTRARDVAPALGAMPLALPELAELALGVPRSRREPLRLRTPARLVPWTLGVLAVEADARRVRRRDRAD